MKIIYTDVLVIGGGLAGLRMAVAAKRRGHDAIVLSLVPPKRSHSKAAQGGTEKVDAGGDNSRSDASEKEACERLQSGRAPRTRDQRALWYPGGCGHTLLHQKNKITEAS